MPQCEHRPGRSDHIPSQQKKKTSSATTETPPSSKAGSANRGTLSPRQKQDVLFAAEVTRIKGIVTQVHGIRLSPPPAAQEFRASGKGSLPAKQGDADPASSKSRRSDTRLKEFLKSKVEAKWPMMVKKLLHMAAHCRHWKVASVFLADRLAIRSRSLDFMRRVIRHQQRSRKRVEPTHTPPPSREMTRHRRSLTPSTPGDSSALVNSAGATQPVGEERTTNDDMDCGPAENLALRLSSPVWGQEAQRRRTSCTRALVERSAPSTPPPRSGKKARAALTAKHKPRSGRTRPG